MKKFKFFKILLLLIVTPLGIWALFRFYLNFNLYAQTGGTTIAAAGDIAGSGGEVATSNTVISINPAAVLALGDNQYPDGTLATYMQKYDPSWGRFKAITHPVPGNHEYHTAGAAGYYDYFGAAAGPRGLGYYSFNVGGWHLIALNSEALPSTQTAWLTSDLAANSGTACVIAYWHHPRWSSGQHGSNARTSALVTALYNAHADIILSGHDHTYERFAPMNPAGAADANGIRQFVAGTGGAGLYSWSANAANSQFKQNTSHGVLKLTLNPGNYSWQFVKDDAAHTVLDSGTSNCVGGGGVGPTPTPGGPTPTPGGPTPTPTIRPSGTPVRTPTPRGTPRTPTPGPTGPTGSINPPDVNFDGSVNIIDIGIIVDHYNRLPITYARADVNHDGAVNIIDIGIVVDNYGTHPPIP